MMRVIDLSGAPMERGRQHGEELRSLIAQAVAAWKDGVAARGVDPDARIASLVTGTPYLATLQARFPGLLAEVRGIGEGARVSFGEALTLNLMDEEWWMDEGEEAGCSLMAGVGADGIPVLAQNMDLPAWMDGLQTVLRIHSGDAATETEQVVLSAAGMIGLTGMRRGGVAVGVNTLLQLPRSVRGVPVAFMIRAALAQPNAEAAVGLLASSPHASGQHYAVVDDREVFGAECSARGVAVRRCARDEWLLHTNHPLWTHEAEVASPSAVGISTPRLHSSHRRFAALDAAAATGFDPVGLRDVLADRTSGVCMVASAEYPTSTFGSVEFAPRADTAYVRSGASGAGAWIDAVGDEGMQT